MNALGNCQSCGEMRPCACSKSPMYKVERARAIATQLSEALRDKNIGRYEAVAFVNRHEIIAILEAALEPLAERRVAATIPGGEGREGDFKITPELDAVLHSALLTSCERVEVLQPSLDVSGVLEAMGEASAACERVRDESIHSDLMSEDYRRGFHAGSNGCVIAVMVATNALTALKSPPSPGRAGE